MSQAHWKDKEGDMVMPLHRTPFCCVDCIDSVHIEEAARVVLVQADRATSGSGKSGLGVGCGGVGGRIYRGIMQVQLQKVQCLSAVLLTQHHMPDKFLINACRRLEYEYEETQLVVGLQKMILLGN